MDGYRQSDLEIGSAAAAAFLPPPTIEETGWDILLALYSDPHRELSLEKLGSLVSVHTMAMGRWLSRLEDRRFVTGSKDKFTGELRAVLTPVGRDLLARYFSAVSGLEAGTEH
jgi:hypothetical protein